MEETDHKWRWTFAEAGADRKGALFHAKTAAERELTRWRGEGWTGRRLEALGDCFPLAAMAGREISAAEALHPTPAATERVTAVRSAATRAEAGRGARARHPRSRASPPAPRGEFSRASRALAANLLVSKDCHVCITDIGLSRAVVANLT